jgi:hypothetical protein
MAVEDATRFLKDVTSDKDFRDQLIGIFDSSRGIATEGVLEKQASQAVDFAASARQLVAARGYVFSREELFQAAGIQDPEFSPEVEARLRLLDKSLRERGLDGISPLAYTAYSLGINSPT